MGLGVLNARDEHVPGTTFVYGDGSHNTSDTVGEKRPGLKYDISGSVPIILVPQPSDDPNDPLNWPRWKRDSILFILCLASVIASTLSPLLAADSLTLVLLHQTTFQQVALLTGYHLLGVGIAGFLFVATARVWGKRHLYLLGTVLIIVSSAWGGASGTNYKSLLWARVIQGVGLAPFEALVNASVGDLYFVHERGLRMAISNMALFGGAFFTPIVVGKIAHTLGWQWSFYLIAIFMGVMLPLIFLFVPETAFRRPEVYNTDLTGDTTHVTSSSSREELAAHRDGRQAAGDGVHPGTQQQQQSTTSPPPAKATFVQSLALFNGRKTDENVFKLVLRPLPLFLHPGVLWACLIQGALIGWTVLIGVVIAAIFIGPPLWFVDEVKTGYMYAGPFIGALLGFALSGLLSDWSTRAMIRRNGGVFEPEFRIVLVAAQLVLGCVGLYGFGYFADNVTGWFLPVFFFALEVMGMVIGAVASALYIVDAHRDIAVEAFTCLLIFKNVFSFGLTFGAYGWLVSYGPWKIFVIIGSVQVAICLLSIPMYIFGKRNRAFMHRNNILQKTGLW